MATKAEPVKLGPFVGGLNTFSDASAVADEDAVELLNFDVDLDGALVSRPPITRSVAIGGRYSNRFLGYYVPITTGKVYFVFSCTDAAGAAKTSYWNVTDNVYGDITTTMAAAVMVQWQGKAWLIAPPGQANPGGSWDGTTFTAVPTMPKGATASVHKNYLFIGTGALDTTNPSRVYWSKANAPTDWTDASAYNGIGDGDGQPLVAIYSWNGILICWKTKSTYSYGFESLPGKGQIQVVSATIGLENADCYTEVENVIYCLYDSDLYSISNWVWEQQNIKVPFSYRNTNLGNTWRDFSVSNLNGRVMVRFYDNYYVFGTKTRTWALWQTQWTPHRFWKSPIIDTVTGIQTFYCGNYLTRNAANTAGNYLFAIKDTYTAIDTESFTCRVKTKVYSFNVPYSYKRLMWWGIDLLTKSTTTVIASPVVYGRPVRILDIEPYTIGQLNTKPINALLDVDISVSDSANIKNPSGIRMFVKYLKSLRFRQIQFQLSSVLDGTTATGPLHIYSMTAFIINKELVEKKIN